MSRSFLLESTLFESIQQSPIDAVVTMSDPDFSGVDMMKESLEEEPLTPPIETPLIQTNCILPLVIDSTQWLHQLPCEGITHAATKTVVQRVPEGLCVSSKDTEERLVISTNGLILTFKKQFLHISDSPHEMELIPVTALKLLHAAHAALAVWRSRVVRLSMDTDEYECSLMDDMCPPRTFLVEFKKSLVLKSVKVQATIAYWETSTGRTVSVPSAVLDEEQDVTKFMHQLAPELVLVDGAAVWQDVVHLRAMCLEEDHRIAMQDITSANTKVSGVMNLKNLNDLIKPISFGPSVPACVEGAAVTVLSSESDSEVDRARALAVHALSLQGDIEHPLMFMDMEKVLVQFKRWKACLPAVEPYYAVKCNPDPVLVAYLQSLGANFDCATSAEIDLVVNQLGHNPEKVIYSNPCKLASHIRFAKEAGVRLTIIDNMDEIPKIKRNHPNAQVLTRLACADTSSQCPMSCKFGVPNDVVEATLTHAMEHQLEVVGVHFHVGSGCSDPAVYHKALLDARRAFDIGTEIGHKMHTLDLGGGFPGLGLDGECKTSNGVHFEEMAKIINSLLIQLFPQDDACNPIRIMAEPGRFMCAGSAFLLTKIHSKCLREDSVRYYLNDGLYGCFNCVLYDHQTVRPETLDRFEGEKVALKATIFGPTCDGFDKIIDGVDHLPELNVDDRLVWMSMGAYTTAASTTFNGFPQAKYFYYKTM